MRVQYALRARVRAVDAAVDKKGRRLDTVFAGDVSSFAGVTSDQCSPCGLIRNCPALPGSARLK